MGGLRRVVIVLAASFAMGAAWPVLAQSAAGDPAAWGNLSQAQRDALAPLRDDWSAMGTERRQKWADMAARFKSMTPEERSRVQTRMSEWSRMSPTQRDQARLNFQESRQLAPQERQARWEAYQALTPEKRRELNERAVPPPSPRVRERPAAQLDAQVGKSNIVGNNASIAPPPRTVAPSTIQADPGATTTLMSQQAKPPAHQQPGMPKIAATPGFVDRSTLLPQRGPQGAAVRQDAPDKSPKSQKPNKDK